MGFEARILALRLGFRPRDWDLGLGTGIWASRLGAGGRTEDEEEKIRHMCESIGHRPIRGRCQKRDVRHSSWNGQLQSGGSSSAITGRSSERKTQPKSNKGQSDQEKSGRQTNTSHDPNNIAGLYALKSGK